VSNVSTTGVDIYRIERGARCADATRPLSVRPAIRSTAALAQPLAAGPGRHPQASRPMKAKSLWPQPHALERLLRTS